MRILAPVSITRVSLSALISEKASSSEGKERSHQASLNGSNKVKNQNAA